MRIPYSSEQGIILVKQGILEREQGILSAGIEITPDEIFGTKSLGWCPLLPLKRTFAVRVVMSAKCHKRTFALQGRF